jgi:HSP20 family molecular chaperone IbpA
MKDPMSVMWAHACEMLEEAERLQRQFFYIGRERRSAWEPPVDIYEGERDFTVCVALPGVSSSQIEIAFDKGMLIIAGERVLPAGSALIRRLEIPHGRFERRIALPSPGIALARRELIDGCLVLTLSKGNTNER